MPNFIFLFTNSFLYGAKNIYGYYRAIFGGHGFYHVNGWRELYKKLHTMTLNLGRGHRVVTFTSGSKKKKKNGERGLLQGHFGSPMVRFQTPARF